MYTTTVAAEKGTDLVRNCDLFVSMLQRDLKRATSRRKARAVNNAPPKGAVVLCWLPRTRMHACVLGGRGGDLGWMSG